MKRSLLSLAAIAIATLASAVPLIASSATPPVKAEAGRLSVTLSPDAKWTMRGITFDGVEVGQSNGNYGTVIAHTSGKFIGAAHTEGGEEEMLSLSITSDGAPAAVNTQHLSGEVIERTKRSKLGDAFALESKLTIRDAQIDETVKVKAVAAAPLNSLYPLMMIWSKESTAWACMTKDGRYLTGTLQSDGEWKVQEDVKWLAIYHPQGDIVTLTVFPEDFPAGKSRKHGLWDHPAYHKQYFIAGHGDQVQADKEFEFSYTVHFLKVAGDDWQGDVERFTSSLP